MADTLQVFAQMANRLGGADGCAHT
jgi:hypothetical protein